MKYIFTEEYNCPEKNGSVYIHKEIDNPDFSVVVYCVKDNKDDFTEAMFEGFLEELKDGDPNEYFYLDFSLCSREFYDVLTKFIIELQKYRPRFSARR